jgi:Fe-S-cluster formation regulator IscX/YfhJ
MNRAFFPLLLLAAVLTACGQHPPDSADDGPIEGRSAVVAQPRLQLAETPDEEDVQQDRWLTFKDTRDPVLWLSGFDDSPEASTPARREALLEVIGQLDERYLEDPRMLANRTVQLRNMLAEIGVHQDLLELLRGFAALTQGEEGREDQFGEKVAFYVRLRSEGAQHDEAVHIIESATSPDMPPGEAPAGN